MIIAATGHRPERVGGYGVMARRALGAFAVHWLHYNRPDQVITGMALGWDQAVAGACVVLDIPFVAAIPFKDQAVRWPTAAQERWHRLLDHAAHAEIISPGPLYDRGAAFQRRNEWMVDRAHKVLALWDGTMGGTFNCVRYAEWQRVEVVNLWLDWSLPESARELLS